MNNTKQTRQNHIELAQSIIGVIKKSKQKMDERLYEQTLADQCNVSRTPVRAALKLLEQQGVVNRRDSGGFSLAVHADTLPAIQARLLAGPETIIYDKILRDRTAHRLEKMVTAASLMRRYQCSRKIVQNVLKILVDEQLIERAAGQSWVFRPLLDDPQAIKESYRLRLAMEPLALLEPNHTLDIAHMASLRKRMQALLDTPDGLFDTAAFFQTDFEFHEVIARGCGNRFFVDALLHHLRLRRLPQAASQPSAFRLKTSIREHLAIIDHLEAGHLEAAADTMRLHLRLSSEQRPNIANWGAPAGVGIRYPPIS